jgi:hypothetical protein
MKSVARLAFLAAASLCASSAVAQADTFLLTSCHITGSACNGGFVSDANAFGSVVLQQSGGDVTVDVTLFNGNRFVETGAGGGNLFDFNAGAGTSVTGATATLNGVVQALAVSGTTNTSFQADGFGFFTANVHCTNPANCNGGSTPNINDLHFTVTNITLAQIETPNADGFIFVADVFCGATQPTCPGGLTGPVDVSQVPGPVVGAGLPGLVMACGGLLALGRRRRQKVV